MLLPFSRFHETPSDVMCVQHRQGNSFQAGKGCEKYTRRNAINKISRLSVNDCNNISGDPMKRHIMKEVMRSERVSRDEKRNTGASLATPAGRRECLSVFPSHISTERDRERKREKDRETQGRKEGDAKDVNFPFAISGRGRKHRHLTGLPALHRRRIHTFHEFRKREKAPSGAYRSKDPGATRTVPQEEGRTVHVHSPIMHCIYVQSGDTQMNP